MLTCACQPHPDFPANEKWIRWGILADERPRAPAALRRKSRQQASWVVAACNRSGCADAGGAHVQERPDCYAHVCMSEV
jgi:hypothetical protein